MVAHIAESWIRHCSCCGSSDACNGVCRNGQQWILQEHRWWHDLGEPHNALATSTIHSIVIDPVTPHEFVCGDKYRSLQKC